MQNRRGHLEIRLGGMLVAQHSVGDQSEVNPAQTLRRTGEHLRMGGH